MLTSALKADAPPRSKCARLFTSAYSWANIVYICYAVLIVVTNFYISKQVESANPSLVLVPTDDDYGAYDLAETAVYRGWVAKQNWTFLAAGIVHLLNTFQYAAVWRMQIDDRTGLTYSFTAYVMLPELMNFLSAALYLASAILYPGQQVLYRQSTATDAFMDVTTANVKKIEMAASLAGLVACFGWMYTWWTTHYEGPGRGLTLDDPDVWALMLLTFPSIIYV